MMEPGVEMLVLEESDSSDNESDDEPAAFGGYDFEFVDEPSSEQICSICLVAMRNPVQTVCGHRFCKDCLVGTFSEGQHPACPQDRNCIPEEGGFFNDVAWERNILSLRVKCKMNGRGCDWTEQLRHYQSHFDECQYEDVACGDCDEAMQRRFLDTHLTLECRERIVQCVYCKDDFAFRCLKFHDSEECTRFPLECPQQCGVQDIPREEVESHLKDDCLMTVVVCPYEGAGCTFYDKRINLTAHIEESSEVHLSKTWSAFLGAKHELGEVKGQVEKIEVRVNTLQSGKKAIDEEFGELKLSERKLQEENMSLKKEVTRLRQELATVKKSAATESTSLGKLVRTMQGKLEALERKVTEEQKPNRKEVDVYKAWALKPRRDTVRANIPKQQVKEDKSDSWIAIAKPSESK